MLRLGSALIVLAVAPLLAGCISSSGVDPAGLGLPVPSALAPAKPRCTEGANGTLCNLLATLEPERQGNEVTIAVNPTDPNNVVAGAKDYYPPSAGDCVWNGIYHTTDGQGFQSRSLPGSPWLLLSDPTAFEPTLMSQYWCLTDPVVAFGPDGTLYYTGLAYQGDPVTASKLGDGIFPQGGLNDWLFNRVSIVAAMSRDGGASIDHVSLIDSGSFPVNFHDRQWVEVDQRSGNVYVAWTSFLVPGNLFYKSTDQGQTWSLPVFLDGGPLDIQAGGLFVTVGNQGEVYVSGCGADGPVVTASQDQGESWTGWQLFADGDDEGMEADYRSGMVCMAAADDGEGPYAGNVYMVWSDTRDGSRDIYFRAMEGHHLLEGGDLSAMSHDAALPAVKLNDDAGEADQFFPAVAVSPSGVIDVVWYDRRNDPDAKLLDIYHTYSLDGGRTWAPNARITEASTDPTLSHHQNGMVFIGDYIDLDSTDACAWPVWVDTRAGKADVMTACVERSAAVQAPRALA